MSPRRAHATALTLVNWKGVFFEHFLLDRHVTALEGANGAGKTTVMIAAYVVLLPDLTRLRFVNIGEAGPSGADRGIWGRLGEAGPSYSALEIDPGDGSRVTLGVYLERKAAPSLALTPFVISDHAAGEGVRHLFLDEQDGHEQVSSLEDIQSKAKLSGLSIEVFASSKDYFAHLFERGISPLRLGTDEERSKWNEMLRTSMTGGISRTLATDLRSFLFRQESGLSDTLTRMHKNLDACRRTRIEVGEARTLEQEVRGVASAGRAMLEALVGACREQARESRERRERAEQRYAAELANAAELETRLAEAELRREALAPRLTRTLQAEARAAEHLSAVERALSNARRAAELEAERARLEPVVSAALEHKASASAERQRARVARDAAQQTLLHAASGLGSWQAGLDELHRQANAHRRLRNELGRAQSELARFLDAGASLEALQEIEGRGELIRVQGELTRAIDRAATAAADNTALTAWTREAGAQVRAVLRALDRARAERDRDAVLAERRRAARVQGCAALAELTGAPLQGDLRAQAELELARLAELELSARRCAELRAAWHRHSALEERRRALLRELEALGLPPLASASEFIQQLTELESALQRAERERREQELLAERAARETEHTREQIEVLAARRDVYARLEECAARSLAAGVAVPRARADLSAALRANDEARQVLSARAAELAAQSREALERALECDAALSPVSAPMAELADLCEGEPLATRYDDLDADSARWVQAELGPLADAIVVADPERTAEQILASDVARGDVWLLRPGAALPRASAAPQASGASAPTHVVVDMGFGLRVSPLPQIVTLGRAARRRQAEALRAEAEAAARASSELLARERQQRTVRGDLEALQEHWEAWSQGDPQAQLERARERIATLHREQSEAERIARERRIEIARLEARRDALRAELPHHHLLDRQDQPDAAALLASVEAAENAAAELARAASARKVLLAHIHDLDAAAPDEARLAAWQQERSELDEQRLRLFALVEALEAIESNAAALAWSEAEAALAERSALVPELEAQHRRAEQELRAAQLALEAAEVAWERATESAQAQAASLAALDAHAERARAELAAQNVKNPDAGALEHARSEVARQAELSAELRRAESSAHAEVALWRERASEAEKRARAAAKELELERERESPAADLPELDACAREVEAWKSAHTPGAEGAEPHARAGAEEGAPRAASSAERWLAARAKCELLADRLARARGGSELAERVKVVLSAGTGAAPAGFLGLWHEVKAWLARRLPAPLAELGEPLVGLARLETDLAELERRLERQEGDLRGTSGDIARSIDVQLRRATTQLRRLNQSLDGVRFGSIHAIRVKMERAPKMERVLGALRDGETQELLFQTNLPIEAALDEIFRRHAGGRTGGQRLLDFREYLEVWVEIQRRPEQGWERVSASQVSTGEAIGIGAALMMVILTEWEKADLLLRRPRQHGSLRFLFLDEANRLSQDNLGVLFDLCQGLDLQLLIAAPEVARAEGNTTYRLVRRATEDGREEVLVTGRRSSLPEVAAAPRTHEPGAAGVAPAPQIALFGE